MWPDSLVSPARPPLLVYLDLNHWIGLAKADASHRDGVRYTRLLEVARAAKRLGTASFVLSDSLVVEMSNIADPRQRGQLAAVMEELTGFATLLGRPSVMRLEVQAAIEHIVGPGEERHGPIDLIGYHLTHGLGVRGRMIIKDRRGRDVTDEVRGEFGAHRYDAMKAMAEADLNWALLRGPQDDELEELRRHGYAPERHRQVTQNRLNQELELVDILNRESTNWRKGRLRDLIGARECVIELLDMIVEALMPRGMTLRDVVEDDRTKMRNLARGMPTTEVAMEIKTQYHRDPNKPWAVNDIYDIDALAVAVPYCDVVFTDAAARRTLTEAHLDSRMKTALPRRPDELADLLIGLPQS